LLVGWGAGGAGVVGGWRRRLPASSPRACCIPSSNLASQPSQGCPQSSAQLQLSLLLLAMPLPPLTRSDPSPPPPQPPLPPQQVPGQRRVAALPRLQLAHQHGGRRQRSGGGGEEGGGGGGPRAAVRGGLRGGRGVCRLKVPGQWGARGRGGCRGRASGVLVCAVGGFVHVWEEEGGGGGGGALCVEVFANVKFPLNGPYWGV
jgi:hypothetical protein